MSDEPRRLELGGPPPEGYNDPANVVWGEPAQGLWLLVCPGGDLILRVAPRLVGTIEAAYASFELPGPEIAERIHDRAVDLEPREGAP